MSQRNASAANVHNNQSEDDVDFESPVLECVTGAGHHSPLGISRIKASVHELVDSLGLRCEVKNAGSFLIYC